MVEVEVEEDDDCDAVTVSVTAASVPASLEVMLEKALETTFVWEAVVRRCRL